MDPDRPTKRTQRAETHFWMTETSNMSPESPQRTYVCEDTKERQLQPQPHTGPQWLWLSHGHDLLLQRKRKKDELLQQWCHHSCLKQSEEKEISKEHRGKKVRLFFRIKNVIKSFLLKKKYKLCYFNDSILNNFTFVIVILFAKLQSDSDFCLQVFPYFSQIFLITRPLSNLIYTERLIW